MGRHTEWRAGRHFEWWSEWRLTRHPTNPAVRRQVATLKWSERGPNSLEKGSRTCRASLVLDDEGRLRLYNASANLLIDVALEDPKFGLNLDLTNTIRARDLAARKAATSRA